MIRPSSIRTEMQESASAIVLHSPGDVTKREHGFTTVSCISKGDLVPINDWAPEGQGDLKNAFPLEASLRRANARFQVTEALMQEPCGVRRGHNAYHAFNVAQRPADIARR
jgi:hypothetical protein